MSFLSVGPKITYHNDYIFARSSLLVQLISLFSFNRKLLVNKVAKKVHIQSRYFWFYASNQEYDFKEISHIDYNFDDIGTDNFGNSSFKPEYKGRNSYLEIYKVGLLLFNRKSIGLYVFLEEELLRSIFGIIFLGREKQKKLSGSEYFVDQLSNMIQIGVGVPNYEHYYKRNVGVSFKYYCQKCQKMINPENPKCQYCGFDNNEAKGKYDKEDDSQKIMVCQECGRTTTQARESCIFCGGDLSKNLKKIASLSGKRLKIRNK